MASQVGSNERRALHLTRLFNATITETFTMPRGIAVELILPGLHRPLRTPQFEPHTASALGILDRWRTRAEIAPDVADRAERLLEALARAGR